MFCFVSQDFPTTQLGKAQLLDSNVINKAF
jgi:hypothetical protein